MQMTIDRKIKLTPEEVAEAIYNYLKSEKGCPVPPEASDLFLMPEAQPLSIEVSWSFHETLP